MQNDNLKTYLKNLLKNIPSDWLKLTTHRLDLYDEKLAKTQFLEKLEILFQNNKASYEALSLLPTAFDYIRLGHPLSCVLEWLVAKLNNLEPNHVISFSSNTMPILAILRKNIMENKNTQICYSSELPKCFDVEVLREVYGYKFDLLQVEKVRDVPVFDGSSIFVSQQDDIRKINWTRNIDFFISTNNPLGSVVVVNGEENKDYISEIQHVRRRETIAMTPVNCLAALKSFINEIEFSLLGSPLKSKHSKTIVLDTIKDITGVNTKALLSSSGLSIQYAILMGLIDDAMEKHGEKKVKIVVPPNCYGGTNDQARRIAACIEGVEVVDLPVDGDSDMVQSIDLVLKKIAKENAIPFIIAEIPTNPRVEVPDLINLKEALGKERKTPSGEIAEEPVFILDQTFCPNVHFLGEGEVLASIKTIAYVSGSKFPSGGLCTAGYCVANRNAEYLMKHVEKHLRICDNKATDFQVETLAKQMPSMNQRIAGAYKNTREFVNYIKATLPGAKVNFVSEELAKAGFTPSVFSLDLPSKGSTKDEKESYKRDLNYRLINAMITEIPDESKFCVSYGQLKGCYWTIPATSTQGTTKEGDKDYIVRVSLSPKMNLEKHKKVFLDFVECFK